MKTEFENKIIDPPDNARDVGNKTKMGVVYTVFSNGGQFCIRFIGSIILARLLFPEDFGLMAIVSMVMQFANRLTNFGFAMVLVQRKELHREHIETVFITNMFLMTLLTISVFSSAPFIADFFNNESLVSIIRFISFNFLLLALTSIPRAMLRRNMMFKQLEIANSLGKLIGVIFPVLFALSGLGVWSLVYGVICSNIFLIIILTAYSRWWPKFKFNFWALKDVFSFGLWVYIAGYVNYGINKVDYFTIGKLLSVTQLGFYERAFNLMSLPRQQIAQRIGSVMFSSYSRLQDNDIESVALLKKVLLHISMVTYPLMAWMFFAAPPLIAVLFGHKWLPAVYPFQIMCISGIMDTITLILDPTVMARGYIGQRVMRDFAYFLILTIFVVFGSFWGIVGVAWGTAAASIIRFLLKFNLVRHSLPFSLTDFILTQRSAIVYSACLVFGLFGTKALFTEYFGIYSASMLICLSFTAAILLISIHLIIRYDDVNAIIAQILNDIKRVKKKVLYTIRYKKI